MEYIEIQKKSVPYRFDISLAGTVFIFEIHYNSEFDFFTVDLTRDTETLATGEKIVYGIPLFADIWDNRFPAVDIVPLDMASNTDQVTWETLGEKVLLYVVSRDE